MTAGSLPAELAQSIVARLRAAEPRLAAVLLCGSFARGQADRYSDADIVALSDGPPERDERGWLEPRPGGRPLQVSLGAESLDAFLGRENEPANWALGFPICEPMTILWATPQARQRLGDDPSERLPAAPPELGDFVELCMKVRRAAETADALQLRWAGRLLVEFGAGLLRPFNPVAPVATPLEALAAAIDLPVAPAHYREDFRVCAGLTTASDAKIAEAAARFGREMLAWLRKRMAGADLPADDIGAALLDGSLEAYIAS